MTNPFNEIYSSNGEIREDYKKIFSIWDQLSNANKKDKTVSSKELYQGDYPVNLFPRLLSKDEYSTLRQGVEQRAETILKLLYDFYNGNHSWHKIIPEDVLNQIYDRNHRYDYRTKLNPSSISFPYGPDIIRDSKGNWRILEDNIGNIGGIGALAEGQKILFKLLPQYKDEINLHNRPTDFFEELSTYYRKRAEEQGGIPLLFLPSYQREDDNETKRLAKLFRSNGLKVLSAGDKRSKISIERNRVYYREYGKNRERVGYLILKNGTEALDYLYFRNSLEYKLKHSLSDNFSINLTDLYSCLSLEPKANCLQTSILNGYVGTNFSPGVDFCADKMLGVYMDQLINYYQKDDPIIKSLPSHSFLYRNHNGKWCLNRRMLNFIFSHRDQYVIKRADREAGEYVWIGAKHTKKSFDQIKQTILEKPELYIYQRYEQLSVMGDKIVDLRIHAQVDSQKIIISNTPWGRANKIKGNGKVNISTGGMNSPVLILQ